MRTSLPLVLFLSFCQFVFAQEKTSNYAVDLVNPFVGTGGHGHTFPGATAPFGLVQLSPDTRISPTEWDGCGGYHYSDKHIYGFSHTHLSGTGVADLCDVLVQPMSGSYSFDPKEYRSKFDHSREKAHAGFYAVHLDDENIDVELTSSQRVGMHRITYNDSSDPWLILDLDHRDLVKQASIAVENGYEIVGERRSSSWAGDQRLFYCIRSSRPLVEDTINGNKAAVRFNLDQVSRFAGNTGVRMSKEQADPNKQVILKVGISAVSIEGARKNIDSEMPGWNFDQEANKAVERWNDKLSKITIKGGSLEQRRIFYTSLYHCYIAPYIFNDVDGNYRGMDGKVHHSNHDVYTVFSLWDTYRALHPLMSILEPEITNDWVNTMMLNYLDGGRLPVWELWGNETDCMIGYHSVSVIADAIQKGIWEGGQKRLTLQADAFSNEAEKQAWFRSLYKTKQNYTFDLAVEAVLASAQRDVPGVSAMNKQGFISSEVEAESVSKTLEYAYDDACITTLLGRIVPRDQKEFEHLKKTQSTMRRRAEAWKSMLDPEVGFFKPRKNGGFAPSFDPYEVNFHFTEANAWQYRLAIPQHIEEYDEVIDGKLEKYLDEIFAANEETTGREQADITGLIGQYVHGNEPSHHMAYLYNYTKAPEKTRSYIKRILTEMYQDAPDGIIGNEDCGQMSAWYVMSALGIYQCKPGVDTEFDFGYPLFKEASVQVGDTTYWTVQISDDKKKWNAIGEDLIYPTRINYSTIMAGELTRFTSKREPWPVMAPDFEELNSEYAGCRERPGAPIIHAKSASFSESLNVMVESCKGSGPCKITDAAGTRDCPQNKEFTIYETSEIAVEWPGGFAPVKAKFHKLDFERTITIESQYANQYNAGGDNALIDGIRGSSDFRTGDWQGYQGQDVQFQVDLGSVQKLDSISLGVLQDQNSWIWFPSEVEISTSFNQRQWNTATLTHQVDRREDGGITKDLSLDTEGRKVRWIIVRAKNAGVCPDWHLGAGGKSWIFIDELSIYGKP